jgi:hypothetical protein
MGPEAETRTEFNRRHELGSVPSALATLNSSFALTPSTSAVGSRPFNPPIQIGTARSFMSFHRRIISRQAILYVHQKLYLAKRFLFLAENLFV